MGLCISQILVLILDLIDYVVTMLIQALESLNLLLKFLDLGIFIGAISAIGSSLEVLVIFGKLIDLFAFDLIINLEFIELLADLRLF